MVDGILLDMDTPGGMVAGAFDCADIIARVRDIKPVWALANDINCSAGQLLASAASRRLVTQTARTGSIGVMMAHSNYGAALEKQGVEITLIYSGSHKVDGNPYSHLPDDVRETLQSRMDATRRMFAQKVSAYTGLSVQAVLDTEAAVYSGQEAIDAGLADELVNSTDAITVMRDALDARKSRLSGGRMTKETQSTTVSATASQADVTDVVPATEGENASAAQPDVNAQITSAVAAENSRIMGILNCEEAHGREEQARVLAETPGMTVETARRILAAAPQSAQARSDTALDRLMQGAPAPLAAGMSYSKRGSNALIKFDYTDTLQIKYANHGSTMTLNTQGTAYAGVTAQLWGNSSRPVVYEVGVDGGAYMFYAQKTTSNTYELTVNGACNASAFNQGSDRDLKDNIQVIDNAIDRIRKMNGYTYTLKENGMPYAGVIAQETLEAIPEAVGSMMKYPDGGSGLDGEEGERYYTVDYSGVTGLLVQVARESDDRITALEEENAELRQRLSAIEAALASK